MLIMRQCILGCGSIIVIRYALITKLQYNILDKPEEEIDGHEREQKSYQHGDNGADGAYNKPFKFMAFCELS